MPRNKNVLASYMLQIFKAGNTSLYSVYSTHANYSYYSKGISSLQNENSIYSSLYEFLLLNIKEDILKYVCDQTIVGPH